jgi:hypothetical protein
MQHYTISIRDGGMAISLFTRTVKAAMIHRQQGVFHG